MSEAQKILDMIESVDPNDKNTLDSIDAHVAMLFWENPHEYLGHCEYFCEDRNRTVREPLYRRMGYNNETEDVYLDIPSYTRSRDALKSIRPDGWLPASLNFYGCLTPVRFWKVEYAHVETGKIKASTGLPTEELAELHAIIQAIEHERNK